MRCWHWKSFRAVAEFSEAPVALTSPALRSGYKISPSGTFSSLQQVPPIGDSRFPHLVLVGQSELAETEELARALGLPSNPCPPDEVLLLHAYAKWADQCPSQLTGVFSFVVWNELERSLFACRDRLGVLPLVYCVKATSIALSGDMETLLDGLERPKVLNSAAVAVSSMLWQNHVVSPSETLFEGILSLPPGHYLTAKLNRVNTNRYWRPSIRPELLPSTDAEVWEQTVAFVERAVHDRVAKRRAVGLMFSGGLDSSAIAVATSKCLKKLNRSFLAVCAVNEHSHASIPDERAFMLELGGLENMDLQFVSAAGSGPFDHIENVGAFHTSCIRYSRRFLDDALGSAAESFGADILLSGAYGESTISGAPKPYLLECAVRLRWRTVMQELTGMKKRTGVPRSKLFAAEAWHHFRPSPPPTESLLLNPSFLRAFPPKVACNRSLWPDTKRTQLGQVDRLLGWDSFLSTRPRDYAFAPVSPFQDHRLLEFCLALPARFQTRNGISRFLVRKSFDALLPRSIAWRQNKFAYSPDYYLRYNSQLSRAVEFVAGIRKSDPVRDIVDVERLKRSLVPVNTVTMRGSSPALTSIPRSIYLINFLRQFPAFSN